MKPHYGCHQLGARHHTPPSIIRVLEADLPQLSDSMANFGRWQWFHEVYGMTETGRLAATLPNHSGDDPDAPSKGACPSSERSEPVASDAKWIKLRTMLAKRHARSGVRHCQRIGPIICHCSAIHTHLSHCQGTGTSIHHHHHHRRHDHLHHPSFPVNLPVR